MATAPLYGDPASKARVWSKYYVLLGDLAATVPTANAAFTLNNPGTVTTQWDPVGALTSDTPFDDGEESVSTTTLSAAGFGVYNSTSIDQQETVTVNMRETTLTTLGLLYDASGVTDTTGTLAGTLKLRDPSKRMLLALHRENATQCERKITKNYAYVSAVSKAFGSNSSIYTVTFGVAPASDGGLYTYYLGAK